MRAILKFDLPEDRVEYAETLYAKKAIAALNDVRDMLREKWKHADLEGVTADQLIDELWEGFHDIAGPVMEATE